MLEINRNFEIFTPTDFLAAITQHIPDKNAQMVRYYGWYSNKMRGQRRRRLPSGAAGVQPRPGITPLPPQKLPSKKWRDLIQQVWHTDPLRCPKCQNIMRVIGIIDHPDVAERILRQMGLWSGTPTRPPPAAPQEWTRHPCEDVDPMPDYENVLVC